MPKIDLAAIPVRIGAGYPKPFDEACAGPARARGSGRRPIAGLRRQPGDASAGPVVQPAALATAHEDEFVYVLEGELTLVEDGRPVLLRAGDCACFPKGTGSGHHLRNDSSVLAVYLEVGSRQPDDLTTCSDIDLMSSNRDGAFAQGRNPVRRVAEIDPALASCPETAPCQSLRSGIVRTAQGRSGRRSHRFAGVPGEPQHRAVFVRDIARARSFYGQALGLRLVADCQARGYRVFDAGNCKLVVEAVAQDAPPETRPSSVLHRAVVPGAERAWRTRI